MTWFLQNILEGENTVGEKGGKTMTKATIKNLLCLRNHFKPNKTYNMEFKELIVAIKGPVWRIHDLEIESTNFLDRWDDEESSVTLNAFPISPDGIIDVYIYLGAPNGTQYKVEISGELRNGDEVFYSEEFEVIRNGRLKIFISKNIDDILK